MNVVIQQYAAVRRKRLTVVFHVTAGLVGDANSRDHVVNF